jgi:hypothetical protein
MEEEVASLGTAYLELQCVFGGVNQDNAFTADNLFYLIGPIAFMLLICLASCASFCTILMFLMHPTLTTQTAVLFSCIKLGEEGGQSLYFLREDLHVQCWTTEHYQLILQFALPLFVIYVIGIPLGGYWIVRGNRLNIATIAINNDETLNEEEREHHRKKTADFNPAELEELKNEANKFETNYGFLIAGYTTQYSWWEFVVTLRKVAMSILSTVLSQDYFTQGQLGLLVIFVALVAHTYAAPFKNNTMDVFEFISLTCSGLIFFLGTLSYGPEADNYSDIISAGVFLVIVGWFAIAIGFGVYVAKRTYRAKKEKDITELQIHEDLKPPSSATNGGSQPRPSLRGKAKRESRTSPRVARKNKRRSMPLPDLVEQENMQNAAHPPTEVEMTDLKTRGPTNRPDRDTVHTSQRPRHQSSIGALPPPPTSPRPRSQTSIGALPPPPTSPRPRSQSSIGALPPPPTSPRPRSQTSIGALPPPPTSQRPRRHTSGALGLDDIPLTMVDEHDSKHRSARPELSLDDAAAFYFCGLYLRRGLPVPLSGILAAVKTNGVDISSDDLLELLRASPSSFKELPHTKGNAKSGPRFRAVHIPLVVAQGPTSDRELSSQRSSFSVASN